MTNEITVQQYLTSTALTLWAVLMMIMIIALVGKATAITTTNLLLVMILSTMAFKMLAEHANDVTYAVIDAIRTLYEKYKGES